MFGISFSELAVIFVVVLLVFGPQKLPEIAKSLGALFAQLRNSTEELKREFEREIARSIPNLTSTPNHVDASETIPPHTRNHHQKEEDDKH